MHIVLAIVFMLAILVGPKLWAASALKRYSQPRDYLSGSGGELAVHLLKERGLTDVKVELSPGGQDHYDPEKKAVRLSESNLHGKSLTAVAVAAHEVGHAIQDHEEYAPLKARSAMVRFTQQMEKFGAAAMFAIPVIAAVTRSPSAGALMFVLGFLSLGSSAVAHIVTLPVEWDASFSRALPILKEGGYITGQDEKSVRKILRACALTYVASSLASLLNVWRWVAILRR